MENYKKHLKLSNKTFFKIHVEMLNVLLPSSMKLSKPELDIISTFLSLDEAIIKDDMFNTLARKQVKEELNMSSAALSNHLRTLIEDKKILNKHEITGRITLADFMKPTGNKLEYQFVIENEDRK